MKKTLPVTIHGTVIRGNHIGNTYNVPTANINADSECEGLEFGVYFSVFKVNDTVYPSITNLGIRPTISESNKINSESFIYNFSGDLYGREAEVKLMEFLRPETKFSSIEELSLQIKKDLQLGKVYHKLT